MSFYSYLIATVVLVIFATHRKWLIQFVGNLHDYINKANGGSVTTRKPKKHKF